ncbi:hypothetical protein [Empedobacter sedimenti]|uniref:hypothetical protein n=1 Tax=Empedobacter sedimenti TaxID=3042610 RepID=UPI0024A665C1|nr:hypothetical protein [Empedobacter sedimenti]
MNLLNNDIIIRKYKDEESLWVSQRFVMQVCQISEGHFRRNRTLFKDSIAKGYKYGDFLPDTGKAWRWAKVKGQFYYDYDRIADRKPTHYRSKLGTKHELLQAYEALLSANKSNKQDLVTNSIIGQVALSVNNNDVLYYMYDSPVTFTRKQAEQMATAKAWCIWMTKQMENDNFKLLGITKKQDFFTICTEILSPLNLEGFKISSAEYLRNTVLYKFPKENILEQLNFFISDKYGNQNALVVGKYPIFSEETGEIFQFDIHQAIMFNLYMNPGSASKEYLHSLWEDKYCNDIVEFGMQPVAYRTFCHHLSRFNNEIKTARERHGVEHYKKNVQTYVTAEKLKYSHSLFCADGSGTINYSYVDKKGKQNTMKLYVILITDVASKKIVGWAPSIKGSHKETPQMTIEAVKMAIENTGQQTMFEFISDNHGAFTSAESKSFLNMVFNRVRTIEAGNSQANPAETQFRLFKRSLKDIQSFISTSWNAGIEGQANADYIKIDDLPSYEDACIMMHNLIKRWNETKLRDQVTPNERYAHSIHPNCQPISDTVLRYLFANRTEVDLRYMRGFVNVYKTKGYNESKVYQFEIPNYGADGTEQIAKALGYTNNAKVKVIWDENEADLYTLDGKYIMTCLPAMKSVQSHAELTDEFANGLDHQLGRKKSQTKAIDEFEMALNDAFQELGYSQSMAFGGNKESYNGSQIETETKKINNKQTKTKQRVDRDFNESEWS